MILGTKTRYSASACEGLQPKDLDEATSRDNEVLIRTICDSSNDSGQPQLAFPVISPFWN